MNIAGFQSTTLLDYPGHIACTVFTQGCNFRCPFCQNASLVLPELYEELLDTDEILSRIKKRSSIYEGVCITGGEPTMQKDLSVFIKKIKNMGLLVKLDTNGTSPDTLEELLSEDLLDMIAMDIKASKESYMRVCGLPENNKLLEKIERSVEIIKNSGIDHEFRTTVVKGLHDCDEIASIGEWLKGEKKFFLQVYRKSENIIGLLNGKTHCMDTPSDKELEAMLETAKQYIPETEIRGEDI